MTVIQIDTRKLLPTINMLIDLANITLAAWRGDLPNIDTIAGYRAAVSARSITETCAPGLEAKGQSTEREVFESIWQQAGALMRSYEDRFHAIGIDPITGRPEVTPAPKKNLFGRSVPQAAPQDEDVDGRSNLPNSVRDELDAHLLNMIANDPNARSYAEIAQMFKVYGVTIEYLYRRKNYLNKKLNS